MLLVDMRDTARAEINSVFVRISRLGGRGIELLRGIFTEMPIRLREASQAW